MQDKQMANNSMRCPIEIEFHRVRVTYLHIESLADHNSPLPDLDAKRRRFSLWTKPDVLEYIELFENVAKDYGWTGPLSYTDDKLCQHLLDDKVLIFFLEEKGRKVGFSEVQLQSDATAEIVYFGLLPDYVGEGRGTDLMSCTLDHLKGMNIRRAWLHSCDLDHPRARAFYKKQGFVVFNERYEDESFPRNFMPRTV